MKKNILILILIIIISIFISCRESAGDGEEYGRVVFFDSNAAELIQIYDDGSGYNNFTSVVVSAAVSPSLVNSFGRGAEYVVYSTGPDIRLYMFDGSFDGQIYPGGPPGIQYISVSQDQKYIAFTDSMPPNGYYFINIENPVPVSIHTSNTLLPVISWSPDGEKLVFSSDNGGGTPEIWKYNRIGAVLTQLTNAGGATTPKNPIWSPGGDKILFLEDELGIDNIFTVSTDGSDRLKITDHTFTVTNPAWSPDGRRIAYISNGQLYVVNSDGSSSTQIAPSFIDGTIWAATQVCWSTYSTKLAVTLNSAGSDDLYIVDPETDDFYMLADGAGDQRNPVWLAN